MIKKLLFLLTAVMGTTLSMNAQNLILNGGFETSPSTTYPNGDNTKPLNTFANWNAANGYAQISKETTNVHSGSSALKAISTGAAEYNVQLQSDAIATVIGTSYEVTFWIKSVGGASTMRLSTSPSSLYQPAQTIGTTWQQVTWGFTANSATTQISFDLGKSTETFYIDDVEMYTISKNNIVNGGFETSPGTTYPNGDNTKPLNIFTNWNASNGSAQMSKETINVRTGTSALKAISTGAAEFNVQLQSDDVPTIIGRNYEIAIWIKSVGGASTMRLSTAGTGVTAAYGTTTTIGTTWQRLALAFKATATATKLSIDLGKSTETFYIDDAVFNSAQTVALGVSDFNTKNDKIVFYPNPVKDNLNISSDSEIKSITITDLTGKTVRTIKNAENIQSIDLSGLNQGMYILSTDTNKQFKFLKN